MVGTREASDTLGTAVVADLKQNGDVVRVDGFEEARDMVDQNSREKLRFGLGSQPRVHQSPQVQGMDQRCASLEKLSQVLRWR
jgi:hypothetical protein